jgi:hypothetical protein
MEVIVSSFYTIGTPYEQEIRSLIDSLVRFGIAHDIEGIANLGTWEDNARQKPVFIKRKLNEHKNKAIVWLDADSVVMSRPDIFERIFTDAAFYFKTTGPTAKRFGGHELISAAMYFANNEQAKKLLDLWIAEENMPDQPEHCLFEQRALQRVVWPWMKAGGTLSYLPQSYCRIFDAPEDTRVIVQNQASRRFGRDRM